MRVSTGPEDLHHSTGSEIDVSDRLTFGQERIDQFAEATGDHQWIHVDVPRATAESPFGGPESAYVAGTISATASDAGRRPGG